MTWLNTFTDRIDNMLGRQCEPSDIEDLKRELARKENDMSLNLDKVRNAPTLLDSMRAMIQAIKDHFAAGGKSEDIDVEHSAIAVLQGTGVAPDGGFEIRDGKARNARDEQDQDEELVKALKEDTAKVK